MDFKNLDDVIRFAIDKEQEAVDFYAHCSDQAQRSEMKQAFSEMAKEEEKHIQILKKFMFGQLMIRKR